MKALNYCQVKSVLEAYNLLLEDDKNVILGGGLWLKRTNRDLNTLIDISSCDLSYVKEEKDEYVIGSMTSLRDLEVSDFAKTYAGGILSDALNQVMGVPLRNSATIGGTIMGKFPFSDIITPLLSLDVTLEMYPTRLVTLKDYLKEKGKTKEILVALHVKKEEGTALFKKVKLTDLGFAILNVAVSKLNNKYRIVVGARPGVAQRALEAEEIVNTKGLNDETILEASELVTTELSYLDAGGNSKDYRKDLARVYVRRFLKEIK